MHLNQAIVVEEGMRYKFKQIQTILNEMKLTTN